MNAQLSVMHDMGELINSITDMSKLLNIIINMVRDVMNVEICTLMMIDEESDKLVLTDQGGLSENIEENFKLTRNNCNSNSKQNANVGARCIVPTGNIKQ